MIGHDLVIHAAAVKVIPVSEFDCLDTYDVNVNGSLNVFSAAIEAGIQHVIAISTDKACHPANAYGATKLLMEECAQEYARYGHATQFHLVRYGNVLESSGSVIEAWKNAVAEGRTIKITDPEMTRFFISPSQAVELVLNGLKLSSGLILIPKMKAMSIGKLAEYTLAGDYKIELVPLRPGEKMHETLLTVEEGFYAAESEEHIFLRPTTSIRNEEAIMPYSSDIAPELSEAELAELLGDK